MRQITIVETGTNTRTVIETEATTVEELLQELDARGIDYTGMSLFEGISNAEYSVSRPNAILPSNLPWKGETTNNLVFMLTPEKKNIKSGAWKRVDLFKAIKDGGYEEDIKNEFGIDYTHISNANLAAFLDEQENLEKQEEDAPAKEDADVCNNCVMGSLLTVIVAMAANGVLSLECLRDNLNTVIEELKDEQKINSPKGDKLPKNITESDIEDMLEGLVH